MADRKLPKKLYNWYKRPPIPAAVDMGEQITEQCVISTKALVRRFIDAGEIYDEWKRGERW